MVGCGKWGKKVADEIEKHKDFKLKSIVCSQKNDQLENISNISTYKNLKKMLEVENLDCLYVAKNPKTNVEVFDKIKEIKLPTILEKPIANTLDEALKIYEYVKKYKLNIFINLPNIYSDTFDYTKKYFIKNEKIIQKILIYEGDLGPVRDNCHPILDWGSHSIAYILKLFKNKELKKVKHLIIKTNKDNYNVSRFDFFFNSKINVKVVTGNYFKKRIRILKIILKNGDIFTNDFNTHKIFINKKLILNSKNTPIENLLDQLNESIKKGIYTENLNNIYVSTRTLEVIKKNF